MKAMLGFILLAIITTCVLVESRLVTIDNLKPRLDVNGVIMDAHDGTVRKYEADGPYYMHAMQYGLCTEPAVYGCDQTADHCGFHGDHNISIYKSNDLSSGSWEYVGNSISYHDRPAGVVFRPHAVYNPNTKQYMLFFNYDGPNSHGVQGNYYAIATSEKVDLLPYKLKNDQLNVSMRGGGDFDVFVDDDGKGYVIYSSDYVMRIEELNSDFLSTTGRPSYNFTEYFVEAPVMFKRDNLYYVLFGYCCCYCEQGSGIRVHIAKSPMGPYVLQDNVDLACRNETSAIEFSRFGAEPIVVHPTPGQGCQYSNSKTTSITHSQQNFVVEVRTPNGTEYLWNGDRWQQAPDRIKGHDPQFWVPLKFDSQGRVAKISWTDSFSFNIA